MVAAALPADEKARIEKLEAYQILDTMPEQVFDDMTYLAAQICGTPIALISLVDSDRQWFKSRVGLDVAETSRDVAFCAHAILEPDQLFEVGDAHDDERFADNELVTDGVVRFYAGAPLQAGGGSALGTICVIDQEPRQLSDEQRAALAALSRQVMGQLELRKSLRDLEAYQTKLERYHRQLEAANEKLSAQRHTDSLTGLSNRRAFDRRLEEEVHRAQRYGSELSLIMTDVDHFKRYNDEYGHAAGDEVLKLVADAMAEVGRASDFVARFGGEEFVVILPETALSGAVIFAERFRRGIAAVEYPMGSITASLGVAELEEGESAHDLLKRADAALYAAKDAGRNRVVEAPGNRT
jgi:diguanylate cyclase (GGDEF)-like protein